MDNFQTNKLGRLGILVENLYRRTYNISTYGGHIRARITTYISTIA